MTLIIKKIGYFVYNIDKIYLCPLLYFKLSMYNRRNKILTRVIDKGILERRQESYTELICSNRSYVSVAVRKMQQVRNFAGIAVRL